MTTRTHIIACLCSTSLQNTTAATAVQVTCYKLPESAGKVR